MKIIDNTRAKDWYEEGPDGLPIAWHIVRTEPQRETRLAAQLVARGIPAYNPQVRKEHRSRGRQTCVRWPALFPGYLFVLLGQHPKRHDTIRKLPGFLSFLHSCGPLSSVALIEGRAIAALGEQEFKLSTPEKKGWTPFTVGQSVRFSTGAFEGLYARIIAIGEDKRISVLREMFGRETSIQVHAGEIEAA